MFLLPSGIGTVCLRPQWSYLAGGDLLFRIVKKQLQFQEAHSVDVMMHEFVGICAETCLLERLSHEGWDDKLFVVPSAQMQAHGFEQDAQTNVQEDAVRPLSTEAIHAAHTGSLHCFTMSPSVTIVAPGSSNWPRNKHKVSLCRKTVSPSNLIMIQQHVILLIATNNHEGKAMTI